MFRCQVMYPIHPRFRKPLDTKQITTVYMYLTGELTECLKAKGYQVG
jgi:hypothetical protein